MTAEGAFDFFSQLGQKDQPQANQSVKADSGAQHPSGSGTDDGSSGAHANSGKTQTIQETISRNINWDESAEGTIK